MHRLAFLFSAAILLAGARSAPASDHDLPADHPLTAAVSLVDRYCIDCHNALDPAAGFDLEHFDVRPALQGEAWDTAGGERVLKRLVARQMPPVDASRPGEAEYEAAIAALERALDRAAERNPQPGRTDSIRRLNRTEYRHAVRDLLALDVDLDSLLPADPSGHGFDNVTVGELSPVLLSRYVSAAERIARLAVGGSERSPGGVTFRLPADRTQDAHVDGLPLGTRGGLLVTHHFAQTGEYELQLRLMRDRDENVEGLNGRHEIDFLLDRGRVHRFTVQPPRGQGYGRDDTLVDAHLKKRFRVDAGPHQVGVTFPQKSGSLSEIRRRPFDASFNRHRHPRQAPAIFQVSIVGPFDPQGPGDTPSRRRIFTCRPAEAADGESCARRILRPLLRRAYRRPVTDDDLAVPMRFFQRRFAADGFEPAIEAALASILVNPHFLLRVERDPEGIAPGTVYRISDLELASRLSFFLWSSIPDEELLAAAEAKRLHRPDVLHGQVRRMLKDERSRSLVENFAVQWLYLRNLESFRPDMRKFPGFDDNLRQALRRETELLFEDVLRNNRSVLHLIRTDTTFLNERLAKHYGIPHVAGSHFRPVTVDREATHRGGLLRQGSILAVTSYATRTSPTVRGNWILENILGTPTPPPPPNVPSLKDKTSSEGMTVRQRLAEHRANPACASCHDLIDPVGFALENFDAVGRWRLFDDGQPIDSAGALPDGRTITDVGELEEGILKRPELFVGALTEKLLTFALGRGIELEDGPAVRRIVREAARDDYRLASLIAGIVTSPPFQMRIAE